MRYFNIGFLVVLFFTGGCASNYNLEVIREAREFALAEHPELSDEAIHCIKFTTPRLANNQIFSRGGSEGSKQDTAQTVVIWDLPDQEGKSLMVVGYGERELHNWSPNRVIIKRFRVMGGDDRKRASTPKAKTKAGK